MPWRSTRRRKSCGVKPARAERRKCGFSPRKLAGVTSRLVKLQRPAPGDADFLGDFFAVVQRQNLQTALPGLARANRPAAPAPTITTSKLLHGLQV